MTSSDLAGKELRLAKLAAPMLVVGLALALAGCSTAKRYPDNTASQAAPAKPVEISKEARLRVARSFRDAGDYASALRLYQQALAENPRDVAALVGIGELYAGLHAYEPARQSFEAALAVAPGNGDALAGLGQVLVSQGQPQAALDYLTKAAAADPRNKHVFNSLGLTYDLLGRHDQAQISYGRGLDHAPGDGTLLNNLALSFVLSKNYETAIRILSSLVTSEQAPAAARQNLAMAYGLSGDFTSAEKLLSLNMTPAQVKGRLFYYRRLQAASPEAQTKALFLGTEPTPVIPPDQKAEVTAPADERAAPVTKKPKPASPPAAIVEAETPAQKVKTTAAAQKPAAPQAPAKDEAPAIKRYSVQLGSYKSEKFALISWHRLQAAHADLLHDYSGAVAEADLGAQGTGYRLYIKEITELAAARIFCANLKARKIDCLVRRFPAAAAPPTK